MKAAHLAPYLLLVAVSALAAQPPAKPTPTPTPTPGAAPAAPPSASPSSSPRAAPAATAPKPKPGAKAAPVPAATPVPATPVPATPDPATPPPLPQDAGSKRPSIAIMAFDYGTIQNFWGTFDIGRGIADQIADVFVNDGSYRVIERSHLDTILAEQDFAQTDRASPQAAQVAKIGKVLGVRYIVAGSITQFATSDRRFGAGGGTTGTIAKSMLGPIGGLSFRKVKHLVQLTGRLIDTSTGEVVISAKGEGQSKKGQGVGVDLGAGGAAGGAGFSMTSADYRSSGLGEAQEKAVTALVELLLVEKPETP